jgi:hypothetical protein
MPRGSFRIMSLAAWSSAFLCLRPKWAHGSMSPEPRAQSPEPTQAQGANGHDPNGPRPKWDEGPSGPKDQMDPGPKQAWSPSRPRAQAIPGPTWTQTQMGHGPRGPRPTWDSPLNGPGPMSYQTLACWLSWKFVAPQTK